MNTLSSLLKFIANSIAPIISDQTAKKVLAAPNGATGKPSFRELGASDITSGTFATSRIPNLDASKINSGTLADARIPNLGASKVTSGVFAVDRIPNLGAGKVTSGTFSADRIPTLAASKVPTALAKSELITAESSADNVNIIDDYESHDVYVKRAGYTFIGVVGVRFTVASSSGKNASGIVLRGYDFGTNYATVYTRKVISADAKVKITVIGLYKKDYL